MFFTALLISLLCCHAHASADGSLLFLTVVMESAHPSTANSDPRAVPAAAGSPALKDIVLVAVGGSEAKAARLMDVLREMEIDTADDLRICAQRNRAVFSAQILHDVTKERPTARAVWYEYLERLLDGVVATKVVDSHGSLAPASPAPTSPASTSPGPKTSHFPWKHLKKLDPAHEHFWETLYVCFVAGSPATARGLALHL